MHLGPIFRTLAKNKLGAGLLMLEIAITMAIVLNCISLISQNKARLNIESGIDEENILTVTIRPFGEQFKDENYLNQFSKADLDALNALEGVISASSISPTPLQGGGSSTMIKPEGAEDRSLVRCPYYRVDQNFLKTLGLELIEGRTFDASDYQESDEDMNTVIITKAFADALFPGGDALGKRVTFDDKNFSTIVGIVRHMFTPYDNGRSGMEYRILFLPVNRFSSSYVGLMIRTEPDAYNAMFGKVVETLESRSDERIITTSSLREIKQGGNFMPDLLVSVLSSIMFLLLVVTVLGIYGMTSFSVARRTRQIGIRRALGATRSQIVAYFLTENAVMTGMGIGLGLILAFLLNGQLIKATESEPLSPALAVVGVVTIWSLGLLSTLLPAVRAARIPPVVATAGA